MNPLAAAVPEATARPHWAAAALPALVVGEVTHRRPGPVRHSFRHRIYQWLIDLDAVPRQPGYLSPFAGFSSDDHLGDRRLTIKGNVENYLALNGIDLGERSRVSCSPAPVSWATSSIRCPCSRATRTGRLACVVAEVHPTSYGERHAYFLRPDEAR